MLCTLRNSSRKQGFHTLFLYFIFNNTFNKEKYIGMLFLTGILEEADKHKDLLLE